MRRMVWAQDQHLPVAAKQQDHVQVTGLQAALEVLVGLPWVV